MQLAVLLGIVAILPPVDDSTRTFDAGSLDETTLEAERYGKADAFAIEDDGLRITLEPGDDEAGWKTPPTLRIGGDFSIIAEFRLGTFPKPAQEDGVAVGLAIATQDVNQPDATLVRLIEPDGSDVYRTIDQPKNAPQRPQPMPMAVQFFNQPGARVAKPPRPTFPADGDSFRLEMTREGDTVRYEVIDSTSDEPRYVGRVAIGPGDLAAVKLFALNRTGAEAVDVLLTSLTIRADRFNGLGTTVRTVFGEVVYGEPIGIEDGDLLIGEATPAANPAAGSQPVAVSGSPPTAGLPAGAVIVDGAVVVRQQAVVEVQAETIAVIEARPAQPPEPDQPPPADPPPTNEGAKGPSAASEAAEPPKPEPKATIPLGEIDTIRFERSPALAGRLLGQPNVDLTGPHPTAKQDDEAPDDETSDDEAPAPKPESAPADDLTAPPPGTVRPAVASVPKAEPEPSGIRDLHLALTGLRDAEITQIAISCPTDSGQASWRLDTSGSTDWPLVIRRAGLDSRADLFLEPPDGDCHEKPFQINITYADNQSASISFQADRHSDPELALDPDEPAPPEFGVRVFLAGGQQLSGSLDGLDDASLRLATPWDDADPIAIPLDHVLGLLVDLPERNETAESFASRLNDRGAEDLMLARTRDGEVVPIPGIAEGLEGDRLRFLYQEQSRTVPLRMVEGLVLADRPIPSDAEADGPIATVSLAGGLNVSGSWQAIEGDSWTVETPWGASLNIPAAEVQAVRFRGGRMTYLSDLEPSRVEQTPYFGRLMPWRRDVNLNGGPLSISGRTFERGLAVHSRCEMTYDLDGRFATFEALIGFDDDVLGLGRVDCRVFADDEELFADPDFRADGPPAELSLPVAGARTLRLVVDFGPDQDTGDRLIWADARLYRDPPSDRTPSPSEAEADRAP